MTVYLWIDVACISIIIPCLGVAAFFLRRAGKFNRITAKLRAGEPLSAQETRLLEQAKKGSS